jgi:hypothetical protein
MPSVGTYPIERVAPYGKRRLCSVARHRGTASGGSQSSCLLLLAAGTIVIPWMGIGAYIRAITRSSARVGSHDSSRISPEFGPTR